MKNLLLSSILVVSLSGCLMPSKINPTLGCGPLGCTSKDYYLPGKGVWAPRDQLTMSKAKVGAIGGVIAGADIGSLASGDPFVTAAGAVLGMVVGHETGAIFDKVDQIHAALVLQNVLNNNADGSYSHRKSPRKDMVVQAKPVATNGTCREFQSEVFMSDNKPKSITGTACRVNGEWQVQ